MKHHAFRAVVAGLLLWTAAATPVAAQTSDSTAVLQQLQRMLDGMRTRNADELRAVFHDQVRMTLLRPAPGGGRRAAILTGEQFIAAATNPNGPVLDEPIRNPVVHLDADLAVVWAEYQVRNAGKVSHCGYDAFTFVRVDGVWKLIAVADTFRQQGCGPVW
ncbi:MAG: nuclear transport factor 2 family protein [Gemmatimonas sp.]|jgi:hypothetical protein|uniref:nuclear transport factor 2 family protein n=1 Tax=Gemmatimonas sp. TaxID=1962908 RepID=UPI00391F8B5C|nr:nuclear transport factor 2 family protein [Gemmatimonadota bacterium]